MTNPSRYVRIRRNRQTGTRVMVASASAVELNDGEGWVVTCEDHDWIMACDTRDQAERQATAPLGWCGICSGEASGADERFPSQEEYES